MSENNKLVLVKDVSFWWVCYLCGDAKYTKEYKKGELILDLCKDCVNKLYKFLNT